MIHYSTADSCCQVCKFSSPSVLMPESLCYFTWETPADYRSLIKYGNASEPVHSIEIPLILISPSVLNPPLYPQIISLSTVVDISDLCCEPPSFCDCVFCSFRVEPMTWHVFHRVCLNHKQSVSTPHPLWDRKWTGCYLHRSWRIVWYYVSKAVSVSGLWYGWV